MVTIKTISHFLIAVGLGIAAGYYAHARIFQSQQGTLATAQFATRLMEDSAALALLKHDDTMCLKNNLAFRIRHGVEEAAFYRTLAANSSADLRAIDDATKLAQEILATPDQPLASNSKPCP